jgi:hypothetical protein
MPTDLPQRRQGGLNRWHMVGLTIGYLTVTGIFVWVAVERASLTETVTTGIAPASLSGKPSLIE